MIDFYLILDCLTITLIIVYFIYLIFIIEHYLIHFKYQFMHLNYQFEYFSLKYKLIICVIIFLTKICLNYNLILYNLFDL